MRSQPSPGDGFPRLIRWILDELKRLKLRVSSHSQQIAALEAGGGGGGGGGSDDQTAAEVPFTPAGSISATDVQAAIEEVAAEAGSVAPTEVYVEDPEDSGTYVPAPLYVGETDPAIGGDDPYAWLDLTDIGGGGDSAIRIEDEGSSVVVAATGINFAGAGVSVTDAGSNEALVTIPGGGGAGEPIAEAHIADLTDAHTATAISLSGGVFAASDVDAALLELHTAQEADITALGDHIAETADAHDASAVSFAPAGTISANNVQDAIAEVAAEAGAGATEVYVEDPEDPGTYVPAPLYVGDTDPAIGGDDPYVWLDPTEMGGGSPSLLVVYLNTTSGNKSTTSATQADVDATNAAVTFTAPASGKVLVRATMTGTVSAAQNAFLGLREGTTNLVNGTTGTLAMQGLASPVLEGLINWTAYLTGITAGPHTYKLAFAVNGGATFLVRGAAAVPMTLEVWGAP